MKMTPEYYGWRLREDFTGLIPRQAEPSDIPMIQMTLRASVGTT
jgi:hypothetical protein